MHPLEALGRDYAIDFGRSTTKGSDMGLLFDPKFDAQMQAYDDAMDARRLSPVAEVYDAMGDRPAAPAEPSSAFSWVIDELAGLEDRLAAGVRELHRAYLAEIEERRAQREIRERASHE